MQPSDLSPPGFTSSIDPVRNILRIAYAGDLTAAGMQATGIELERLLAEVKPGFSILADFGQVTSMDLDCVPALTRVMDSCRQRGVGLIVRILPPPQHDIGIKLLGIVHYRGNVQTVTVDTAEEAERALN